MSSERWHVTRIELIFLEFANRVLVVAATAATAANDKAYIFIWLNELGINAWANI